MSFYLFPAMSSCQWSVLAPAYGQKSIFLNGWNGLAAKDMHLHEAGHALDFGDGRFGGLETGDWSSAMGRSGKAGLCYTLPQQSEMGWQNPKWVGDDTLKKGGVQVTQILRDVLADSKQGLWFPLGATSGIVDTWDMQSLQPLFSWLPCI